MTDTTNTSGSTGQNEKQKVTLSIADLEIRDYFASKALQKFAESTWSVICNMMEGRHGKFSTDEIVKFIQACLISGGLAFLYDHIRGSKSEEQVNEEFQSILEYIRRNSKKEKPN